MGQWQPWGRLMWLYLQRRLSFGCWLPVFIYICYWHRQSACLHQYVNKEDCPPNNTLYDYSVFVMQGIPFIYVISYFQFIVSVTNWMVKHYAKCWTP